MTEGAEIRIPFGVRRLDAAFHAVALKKSGVKPPHSKDFTHNSEIFRPLPRTVAGDVELSISKHPLPHIRERSKRIANGWRLRGMGEDHQADGVSVCRGFKADGGTLDSCPRFSVQR